MTSSQWHFLPKIELDGELMVKNCLSPKICNQGTAFLLTNCCLALPRAQSSYHLNVPVTWIPRALVVIWVMVSDGWPNSTWRLLMFFLGRAVADTALSLVESHRKSTPTTQPSWVLILWSRMISSVGVLTTILFQCSLEILFPCKSLHIRENWFTPALGQNYTGHRV